MSRTPSSRKDGSPCSSATARTTRPAARSSGARCRSGRCSPGKTMSSLTRLAGSIAAALLLALAFGTPAQAATFVYVSNAEDGDIGTYRLLDSGELQPGARAKAANLVMPMAVSPDRRFLYAAVRSKPFSVHAYSIDRGTGELKPLSVSPLAESMPYISLDKTGRFLFG